MSEMRGGLPHTLRAAGIDEAVAESIATRVLRCRSEVCDGDEERSNVSMFWVPGRIEVLGKHTDYAGGRSLVCSTNRGFAVACAPRDDGLLVTQDLRAGETRSVLLNPELSITPRASDWEIFPNVMARRIARDAPGFSAGADVVFESDLADAAGLSSGTALAASLFLAIAATAPASRSAGQQWLADLTAQPWRCAAYIGAVENGAAFEQQSSGDGVGTRGGFQDQAAILCSSPGQLLQVGFDPLREEARVELPANLQFVVAVSGVFAHKTANAKDCYNLLSDNARTLARTYGEHTGLECTSVGTALRQDPDALQVLRKLLPDKGSLRNRLEQFAAETLEIIPAAAASLQTGDLSAFGSWVAQSQANAERWLGNQIPETMALVRYATEQGALAASAFGAGFGGSVWALVEADAAAEFGEEWLQRYVAEYPGRAGAAEVFITRPSVPAIRLE